MTRSQSKLIATYTLVHGVGEFLTALTLFPGASTWAHPGTQILLYSCMAFGFPLVIALLVWPDASKKLPEGRMGLAGTVLMAAGMLVSQMGWACVLLLGLGSAMLHIATGTATLKLPRPGTAVGVFESSGAIGLALGTVLGSGAWAMAAQDGWIAFGSIPILLGGLAVLAWGTPRDTKNSSSVLGRGSWLITVAVFAGLALISVLRAVTSFTAPQPWKQGSTLVLVAAGCVMVGRAVGGVLTDRWGVVPTALTGFIGAGVLLSVWPQSSWAGCAGLFFLAATMAPIIVALLKSTGRPSLAFGLAQFFQVPAAFVIGIVWSPWSVFIAMALCAAIVFTMKLMRRNRVTL